MNHYHGFMASNREEEFELVLGNRHLLSLFFVVVVFFAGFFAVGYTVGYGQGESSQVAPTMARVDPSKEPLNEIRMPDALLKDAPKSPKPTATKPTQPAGKKRAQNKPAPSPVAAKTAAPKPRPTAAKTKPKAKPAAPNTAAARTAAPKAAGAGYHLPVAALRMKKDADMLAGKLKNQGYPTAVQVGGEWNRVMVGPFPSEQEAGQYKKRLTKDGFDTLLRKL